MHHKSWTREGAVEKFGLPLVPPDQGFFCLPGRRWSISEHLIPETERKRQNRII